MVTTSSALILLALAPCIVAPAASGAARRTNRVEVTASFAPPTLAASHPAVTFDPTLVPLGSRVQVVQFRQGAGGDAGNVLVETLRVRGLEPRVRYFAYAYAHACGATPAAAGVRVQDGPSSAHYPQNEIWLGFRTDGHGRAASSARQYWLAPGRARSIVIDARPNAEPVACVTIALQ